MQFNDNVLFFIKGDLVKAFYGSRFCETTGDMFGPLRSDLSLSSSHPARWWSADFSGAKSAAEVVDVP